MAVFFNPIRVDCRLTELTVHDSGEGSSWAQPYVWSVFYRIDGTNGMVLDIGLDLSLAPDPQFIQLAWLGSASATVTSWGSQGNILEPRGSGVRTTTTEHFSFPWDSVRFLRTITPIPVNIRVNGWDALRSSGDYSTDLWEIARRILQVGGECPTRLPSTDAQLNEFIAEFVSGTIGGLPGVFGVIYILLEQDYTPDYTVVNARRALAEALENSLNRVLGDPIRDIVNTVMHDPRSFLDFIAAEVAASMQSAATGVFVRDAINPSLLEGLNFFKHFLAISYPDDQLGNLERIFTQASFLANGSTVLINAHIAPKNEHGENEHGIWAMKGHVRRIE